MCSFGELIRIPMVLIGKMNLGFGLRIQEEVQTVDMMVEVLTSEQAKVLVLGMAFEVVVVEQVKPVVA